MNSDFSRNLIKGKIAEIIFQQMFIEAGEYTIIPFGYENVIPELAQCENYNDNSMVKKIKNTVRSAPDFALISQNKKKVWLIEVKYRSTYDKDKIKKIAENQIERWDPSCLFIATLDGFYVDTCLRIIRQTGQASILPERWISKEIQNKYLKLLNEFEK